MNKIIQNLSPGQIPPMASGTAPAAPVTASPEPVDTIAVQRTPREHIIPSHIPRRPSVEKMFIASTTGSGGGAGQLPPAPAEGNGHDGDGSGKIAPGGHVPLFYTLASGVDPAVARSRSDFYSRFFSIAAHEYDAAVSGLKAEIERIAAAETGTVHVLDAGCGQGHLFERVFSGLDPKVASRLTLDYLDPQRSNLNLYRQRLGERGLGREYEMTWEDFISRRVGTDREYDLIVAFQSLYTLDLKRFGHTLAGFQERLAPNGIGIIALSNRSAAYFRMLEDIGHLFHSKIPKLNVPDDIVAALRENGIEPEVINVPFRQLIRTDQAEDLLVYVAACLYLSTADPVRQRLESVSRYIDENYRVGEDTYAFPQDISFVRISRST